MSASEILAELPKLDASERQLVWDRLMELQQRLGIEISQELHRAIDEADATSCDGDVSIEQAFDRVKTWSAK